MSEKIRVQRVLLSSKQVDALHRIRESQKVNSPYGIAPTIHEIARNMMSEALKNYEVKTVASK